MRSRSLNTEAVRVAPRQVAALAAVVDPATAAQLMTHSEGGALEAQLFMASDGEVRLRFRRPGADRWGPYGISVVSGMKADIHISRYR